MPPLGQFNVKDSTKESKKRRGGTTWSWSLGTELAGVAAWACSTRVVLPGERWTGAVVVLAACELLSFPANWLIWTLA